MCEVSSESMPNQTLVTVTRSQHYGKRAHKSIRSVRNVWRVSNHMRRDGCNSWMFASRNINGLLSTNCSKRGSQISDFGAHSCMLYPHDIKLGSLHVVEVTNSVEIWFRSGDIIILWGLAVYLDVLGLESLNKHSWFKGWVQPFWKYFFFFFFCFLLESKRRLISLFL